KSPEHTPTIQARNNTNTLSSKKQWHLITITINENSCGFIVSYIILMKNVIMTSI
ncbi:unnamed protein product, partial [marine sediment metagenome]